MNQECSSNLTVTWRSKTFLPGTIFVGTKAGDMVVLKPLVGVVDVADAEPSVELSRTFSAK